MTLITVSPQSGSSPVIYNNLKIIYHTIISNNNNNNNNNLFFSQQRGERSPYS